jgi:hypothetical protein
LPPSPTAMPHQTISSYLAAESGAQLREEI